jgi:hypothetical protein
MRVSIKCRVGLIAIGAAAALSGCTPPVSPFEGRWVDSSGTTTFIEFDNGAVAKANDGCHDGQVDWTKISDHRIQLDLEFTTLNRCQPPAWLSGSELLANVVGNTMTISDSSGNRLGELIHVDN